METMFIMPISELDIKEHKISLQDCVALYKSDRTGVINVGNPSLAAYVPAIANMYGFKSATEKGYYLILEKDVIVKDKSIYEVLVSDEKTIVESIRINSTEEEDLLSNMSEFRARTAK